MLRSKFSVRLLVGTLLIAAVAADEPARTEKNPTKDAKAASLSFERFKKLAGDWQLANPKEETAKTKVTVRYRLTAGGSAVVETLFPETDMEMVTIYHRDGDQLMLTHYCCCGNQPRMRAKIGANRDELVFEFAGGSNLDPAKDMHMHSCRVRFVDADRLHFEWESYRDGKPAENHTFDLVRKK